MKNKHIFIWLTLIICSIGSTAFGQQKTIITGQIIDEDNKQTLIGVNIVEVDENGRFVSGTVTDLDGNFTMVVSSENATIQISYLGYKSKTIKLNGQKRLDVPLKSEATSLEEVVVTAQKISNDGVLAVRDRGTAVSRVELKDMEEIMTTSVEEMLQGRMGNVDITAISGDPGAGLNIRIRGTATLNAKNDPMILVNGIPYDASLDESFDLATADINEFGNLIDVAPENIEVIEVLKDAASTAEWGSKAANGIISIKTKRGIKSPPVFSYTLKYTRSEEPPSIPMLDGPDYARLIKMEQFNRDAMESFNSDVSSALRKSIDFDPEWEEYYNYSQNTNWIEEITRVANTTSQNFSVNGGGEKTRYNINLGYDHEQGTTLGTELDKLSLQTALDYDISSKLTFITDVMYTRRDQESNYHGNVRDVAYRKMPNLTVYERDTSGIASDKLFTPYETIQGSATSMYNPLASIEYGQHNRNQNNTRAQFTLKYNMLKSLTYLGSITMDLFDQKISKFLPYEAIGANYYYSSTNQGSKDFNKKISVLTMNRLVFKPSLGEQHDLIALFKLTTEGTQQRNYGVGTSKSASRKLTDPSGQVDINYVGSGSSSFRYLSTFFQLNYKLMDQHIFMASINAEGSSRYSAESRYGFFPAFSYAWRISNMRGVRNLSFLNDLRPRVSWGISGNSPSSNYLFFNSYSASSNYGYNGIAGILPSSPELTGLEWETIEQFNPGISIVAFNNRFTFDFDFYNKHTRQLYLRNYDLPSSSGYQNIDLNDGEMLNRGWEVTYNMDLIKKGKFSFSVYGNVSHNENKVLRMPENYEFERGDMDANGNYLVNNTPGRPIGGFYGYDYLGVYVDYEDVIAKNVDGEPIYDLNGEPLYMVKGGGSNYEFEPGDAKYRDINYDGVIDQLDIVYLGDINPEFMGGFGPRIQYGGFVLNTYFYFKYGRQIINGTKMRTENMYGYDNQSKATKWAWRGIGDTTHMPRPLYNTGYNWLGSDRFVEDGTFLRLKTVSVTYNFPDKICNKLRVNKLKTYVTFYNLFTWTNYSGQDPDVAPPNNPAWVPMDESKTPPGNKMIVGLSFKF